MYSLVLIDDEAEMIDNLKKFIPFNDLNIKLLGCAQNGILGLKCIEEFNPDIVISDINMPGMSGVEMLKHLADKDIKLIFLTGHADFEYAKMAISYGVVDYLLKPIFPQDVISSLEKCIRLIKKEGTPVNEESTTPIDEKTSNPIVIKMKEYIEENFENVSLDKVASFLDMSEDHIRKLFKGETGVNFKQYILSFRMEKAKELLESRKYKVYEVAEMVGYRDIKTFRDMFKEHFGISPSEV